MLQLAALFYEHNIIPATACNEPQLAFSFFHFISFYLFTAYEEVTQLVKDNTT